jgi:predicted secreted Zn-dependent protease
VQIPRFVPPLAALVVATIAAAPGLAAAPAPRVAHATMVYYDVGGATASQLRARLDARAPRSPDGFRGDAFTRWEFSWSWPGYGSASCRLAKAVVKLRVIVSFPRWTRPQAASAALAANWARYSRSLARHEQGHVDYAVARYPAVVRAIKSATCTTANEAAQAQLTRIRTHDVSYDRSTQHGATQGARFP